MWYKSKEECYNICGFYHMCYTLKYPTKYHTNITQISYKYLPNISPISPQNIFPYTTASLSFSPNTFPPPISFSWHHPSSSSTCFIIIQITSWQVGKLAIGALEALYMIDHYLICNYWTKALQIQYKLYIFSVLSRLSVISSLFIWSHLIYFLLLIFLWFTTRYQHDCI